MSDFTELSGSTEQSPASLLDTARANYVELLGASRYLIYTTLKQPDYYDVLDQGAQTYSDAFGGYLLHAAEVEQPDVSNVRQLTVNEIAKRREAIDQRFNRTPLRLYPETEIILGATALGEMGTNIFTDHPTAAAGSALLAATSYMSYQYRRNTHLALDIRDSSLTSAILERTEDGPDDPKFWSMVLDATVDSEKAAIAKLMSQTLRAHTFNPFGYFRQYYYKYRQRKMKSQ